MGPLNFDEIPNGISLHDDIVVFRHDDEIVAAKNRCRHQGNKMRIVGDCLECPHHGWRLDPQTMEYSNPVGLQHETLSTIREGRLVRFKESQEIDAWLAQDRGPQDLRRGELTVQFLSHACCLISTNGKTLMTDPWLVGSAFEGGWSLSAAPPSNWRELIDALDFIYISHSHSDHLNRPTLLEIGQINSEVPILIPNFGNSICKSLINECGLRNVSELNFGEWNELAQDLKINVLPDASGKNDSGFVLDYKGHLILNNVDCQNLNDGNLPSNVDLLLAPFAGGASGFPVCWTEHYGEKKVREIVRRNRRNILQKMLSLVERTQPKTVLPFAGYFTEEEVPERISKLNKKNTPFEAKEFLESRTSVAVWCAAPGEILDLCDGTTHGGLGFEGNVSVPNPQVGENDDLQILFETRVSPGDRTLEAVKDDFKFVKFSGDLVMKVDECSDDFRQTLIEYYVDFRTGDISTICPENINRLLEMKCRSSVFQRILRLRLPWDEMTIGFHCRFRRSPDIYNFDFWSYVQEGLGREDE